MILTAQEEYGVRCALSLAKAQRLAAREGTDDGVTLAQIADGEGMTTPYAGKLLRILVQAGLVESTRGRSGGYRLQRPAAEISVSETLQALGSKIYDGHICEAADPSAICVHNTDCSIRSLWSGLQRLIDRYLEETTLGDLVCDERSMDAVLTKLTASADPS